MLIRNESLYLEDHVLMERDEDDDRRPVVVKSSGSLNARQKKLICHYSSIGYPIFGPTDYTLIAPISSSLLLTDENITVASRLFGEDSDHRLRRFVIISWFPGLIFQLACFPLGLLTLVGNLSPALALLTLPGALFPFLLILRSHWAITVALLERWEPLLIITYSTIFCTSLSYIVQFDLRLSFVWIVIFPTLLSSTIADASSVRLDYAFLKGDLSMTALTLPPYIVSLAYLVSIVLLCNTASKGNPIDTSSVDIRWQMIQSSVKCSYIASSTGCTICLFIVKSIIMLFMDSSRCNSLDASMTMDIVHFNGHSQPIVAVSQNCFESKVGEKNELLVSTKLRSNMTAPKMTEVGSNVYGRPETNYGNYTDYNKQSDLESDDHILEVRFTLKGEVGLDPISRRVTSSLSNNHSPDKSIPCLKKTPNDSNQFMQEDQNPKQNTSLNRNKGTNVSPASMEGHHGQPRQKAYPKSPVINDDFNQSQIKMNKDTFRKKKPRSAKIVCTKKSSASVSPCSHASESESDTDDEPEAAPSRNHNVHEKHMQNTVMTECETAPDYWMNATDVVSNQCDLGTNAPEGTVLTHRQQRLQPFYKLAGAKLFGHHQYTVLTPASSGIIVSDESNTVASELFGELFDHRLRLFSRYMWYPSLLIQIFCVPIGLVTLLGVLDTSAALMTIPGIIFPLIALLRCHWDIFSVLLFDSEQIIFNFFSCMFCISITLIVNWDYRAVYIWTTVFPALFLSAFSDASAARLDHCMLGNQHRRSIFRNIFYFALPPYMASLTSIISVLFILNMKVTLSFNVLSFIPIRTVILDTDFSYGVTASSTGFTLSLFLIRYIIVISCDPKCCVSLRSRMAVSTAYLDPMPPNKKMRDTGYYVFQSHFSYQAGSRSDGTTAFTVSKKNKRRESDIKIHFHYDKLTIDQDIELAGYPVDTDTGTPDKRRHSLLTISSNESYRSGPKRRKSYPDSALSSSC